jgi:hypothetical protein
MIANKEYDMDDAAILDSKENSMRSQKRQQDPMPKNV